MDVLATRDLGYMSLCEMTLLSAGIPLRWQRVDGHTFALDVAVSDAEHVSFLLSQLHIEQLQEHRAKRSRFRRRASRTIPLVLRPPFAFALSMALLLLTFFFVSGGVDADTAWLKRGVLDVAIARDHAEWWRLITAATLHADGVHAVANAAFTLIVVWATTERIGFGMALSYWLLTAIVGFLASTLFSDVTLTLGASGGLFGLLGVATTHALRYPTFDTVSPWRGHMRIVGGAASLLALTAFNPNANIVAHLSGFAAGCGAGLISKARPLPYAWQIAATLLTVTAIGVAWHKAWL